MTPNKNDERILASKNQLIKELQDELVVRENIIIAQQDKDFGAARWKYRTAITVLALFVLALLTMFFLVSAGLVVPVC